eukprot:tig00020684_g12852.t1
MQPPAAKRARLQLEDAPAAPPVAPQGPHVADTGDEGTENPFDQLPDELFSRILSRLELVDAYERSKLWSLDRRWRRLLTSVEFDELRLELAARVDAAQPSDPLQLCRNRTGFLQWLTGQLKQGASKGARRVSIGGGPQSREIFDFLARAHRNALSAEESAELNNYWTSSTALLAALAASGALEHVIFSKAFGEAEVYFGSSSGHDDQRSTTTLTPTPRSIGSRKELAALFLIALLPCATTRCLTIESARNALDLASQGLWERLASGWPGLRAVDVQATSPARLLELAPLAKIASLQELRVVADAHQCGETLLSALQAGLAGGKLASLEVLAGDPVWGTLPLALVDARSCRESFAAFKNLRSLSLGLLSSAAPFLPCLADLADLRHLRLSLQLPDYVTTAETSRGGALLTAAAAALARATRLESLELFIVDAHFRSAETRGPNPWYLARVRAGLARPNSWAGPSRKPSLPPLDFGAMAALLRGARPALTRLALACPLPPAELLEEVARGAPGLRRASLRLFLPDSESLQPLAALGRAPHAARYSLTAVVAKGRQEQTRAALLGLLPPTLPLEVTEY